LASALTGKQKAAMLLMSLDPATVAELLRGLNPEVVQDLAVELAYLDASGLSSKQSNEVARQFYNSLKTGQKFHLNSFLKHMLKSSLSEDKATQIQTQIQDLVRRRDPFIFVRSIDSQTIASSLENEHPQAAAVVLSELPAKKSSEVIGLLGEGIRVSVIGRMASSETITAEAKTRIAQTLCKRLEAVTTGKEGAAAVRPEQSLRKLAVILRNLGKELRDGLLSAIQEKDNTAGEKIANLMIVWEDILQVADRSLQEALRGLDSGKLALALVKAEESIIGKIKSNISERAAATLDEEAELITAPKTQDVEDARNEIVQILRGMNEKGELVFIEE